MITSLTHVSFYKPLLRTAFISKMKTVLFVIGRHKRKIILANYWPNVETTAK